MSNSSDLERDNVGHILGAYLAHLRNDWSNDVDDNEVLASIEKVSGIYRNFAGTMPGFIEAFEAGYAQVQQEIAYDSRITPPEKDAPDLDIHIDAKVNEEISLRAFNTISEIVSTKYPYNSDTVTYSSLVRRHIRQALYPEMDFNSFAAGEYVPGFPKTVSELIERLQAEKAKLFESMNEFGVDRPQAGQDFDETISEILEVASGPN